MVTVVRQFQQVRPMQRYEAESYNLGDGPLVVDGRIVDVLDYNPHQRRVLVLVEKSGTDNLTLGTSDDPEGVEQRFTDTPEPTPSVLGEQAESPTCSGLKANDEPCTREVDEPGDYCWQHEDQREASENP